MLYSLCIGGADEQTTKGQSQEHFKHTRQNKEHKTRYLKLLMIVKQLIIILRYTNLSFGHLDKIMMANKKHITPSVYVLIN